MEKDNNTGVSRRAFLIGHWRNKPDISTACLNNQRVYCQSCKEVCEEEAIVFNQAQKGIQLPALISERCSYCRDCVECCPVDAISIRGNKVA